jgi:hypothetical protein|tara:strand:+ start:276 stop:587 length:312 start_codon:yes stop_codon:yes gene_type:complete
LFGEGDYSLLYVGKELTLVYENNGFRVLFRITITGRYMFVDKLLDGGVVQARHAFTIVIDKFICSVSGVKRMVQNKNIGIAVLCLAVYFEDARCFSREHGTDD